MSYRDRHDEYACYQSRVFRIHVYAWQRDLLIPALSEAIGCYVRQQAKHDVIQQSQGKAKRAN